MSNDKITIEWANPEKNLIRVVYHQTGWTWHDMEMVFREQYALIESVVQPRVDVLVEVGESNWLPMGMPLLSVVKATSTYMHPRQGCTIVVGARGFLKSLANSLMKLRSMASRDFHFVDTMPQANSLLDEIRSHREKAASRAAS